YIVVYYEYESEIQWGGADVAQNCNYKIGFLDSEGNLLESYDTGCGILAGSFGICNVEMRYSEEELTVIAFGDRGGVCFEGVFNMETKEFKVINK
ncbi:MAG: hypothetical protein IIV40_01620, partial [Oscillospiraceae bacterium]|nr:hypothetical protein [Oscillospiraceae bacterium]